MPIKPDAKKWIVLEQLVEDPVTGLAFQFEVTPDGEPRLRLFGESLPFVNREIHFDRVGAEGWFFDDYCWPVRPYLDEWR